MSSDYWYGIGHGFAAVVGIVLLVGAVLVFRACRMEGEAAGFDARTLLQEEDDQGTGAPKAVADPVAVAEEALAAQRKQRDRYAELMEGTSQHAPEPRAELIEQTGPRRIPALAMVGDAEPFPVPVPRVVQVRGGRHHRIPEDDAPTEQFACVRMGRAS
ncbi:hypothetical protein [Crossiella sp. NPDC003009]